MIIVQIALIGFGTIFVFFSSFLYIIIGPIIFEEMKEMIFMHIDGNQILLDNFLQITTIRGTLKLDSLLNLEFITCLVFILLNEQVFNEKDFEESNIPFYVPWIFVSLVFVLLVYANSKGSNVTVSQNLSFLTLIFVVDSFSPQVPI